MLDGDDDHPGRRAASLAALGFRTALPVAGADIAGIQRTRTAAAVCAVQEVAYASPKAPAVASHAAFFCSNRSPAEPRARVRRVHMRLSV